MSLPVHEVPTVAVELDTPAVPHLRTVGAEDDIVDIILADADEALAGLDYEEVKAGFLPTSDFSCEERRVMLIGITRRLRAPRGGKQII
jgi:hypothetical protein